MTTEEAPDEIVERVLREAQEKKDRDSLEARKQDPDYIFESYMDVLAQFGVDIDDESMKVYSFGPQPTPICMSVELFTALAEAARVGMHAE